ncbi:fucose-1-phosphate guanylyltransferase [Platysternon megacephalum]|uniref:Fucose-1-phosphate guanylyltransferase n=1 Tax=Platysternon megacephalum TaxID=55544 RepID=A0A4D9ETQ8_9SAUR|nr:fucose-1-phosphate guanylyltransferase [Platysternon megacephalum]
MDQRLSPPSTCNIAGSQQGNCLPAAVGKEEQLLRAQLAHPRAAADAVGGVGCSWEGGTHRCLLQAMGLIQTLQFRKMTRGSSGSTFSIHNHDILHLIQLTFKGHNVVLRAPDCTALP